MLIPYSEGIKLYNLYLSLSDLYLTQDINKSINFLEKARTLLKKDKLVYLNLEEYQKDIIQNKFDFLINLKNIENKVNQ